MPMGGPGRRQEPLRIGMMIAALVAAAFVGAAGGLAWQALSVDPGPAVGEDGAG